MLKVRCIVRRKNEERLASLLAEYGIPIDKDSNIVLLERGLSYSETEAELIIDFPPDRIDFLKTFLSGICENYTRESSFLTGSRNNTYRIIPVKDILFFRADGNYVYAVTAEYVYEIKYRLYELEEKFRHGNFIRTGKSYIVNIMKVREIIPWFGSRLLLRIKDSDHRIEVSRNYIKSFKQYLEM